MDPLRRHCREETDFLGDPLWPDETTTDRNVILFLDLSTATPHLRGYRWDEVRQLIEQPAIPTAERVRFWRAPAIPANYVYRLSDMWLAPALEPLTRYYNTFLLHEQYERAIGTSYGASSLHGAHETIRVPTPLHRADARAFLTGALSRPELLARVPDVGRPFIPAPEDLVAPSALYLSLSTLYLGRLEDGAVAGYGSFHQAEQAEHRGRALPAPGVAAGSPIPAADAPPASDRPLYFQVWMFDRAAPVHARVIMDCVQIYDPDEFIDDNGFFVERFDVLYAGHAFRMHADDAALDRTAVGIPAHVITALRDSIEDGRLFWLNEGHDEPYVDAPLGRLAFTVYRDQVTDGIIARVDDDGEYIYYRHEPAANRYRLLPVPTLVDADFVSLPGTDEPFRLLVHDDYRVRLLAADGTEHTSSPHLLEVLQQQSGPDQYRKSTFRLLLDGEYYQATVNTDGGTARFRVFHEASGQSLLRALPFDRATFLLRNVPFSVEVEGSGYWLQEVPGGPSISADERTLLDRLKARATLMLTALCPVDEPGDIRERALTYPRALDDEQWRPLRREL